MPEKPATVRPHQQPRSYRAALFVFLVTAAAQLWFVARLGNDIPHWDQWGAEGRALYPVWLDGELTPGDILKPHSEHRIAFTRVLNLSLFAMNGTWDPLVQLLAGVWLRAFAAAAVTHLLVQVVSVRITWILAITTIVLFLPTLAWENVLWGFQSQISITLGLVAGGFSLIASENASSSKRATGWCLIGLSQFSMGAGLLAVPAAMFGMLLNIRRGSRPNRIDWIALGALIVLAASLWTKAPAHDKLHPKSAAELLEAVGQVLAWPHIGAPLAAIVTIAPFVVLILTRLLGFREPARGENGVVLLGLWSLLLAGALAWSRGGNDTFAAVMPSRYIDFLAPLIASSMAAVVILVEARPTYGRLKTSWAGAAWALFMLIGLFGVTMETAKWVLLPRLRNPEAPVRRAVDFYHTNDPQIFAGLPVFFWPSPDLEAMQQVLHDPRLKDRLPPSFQPEQPLGWLSSITRTFLRHAGTISALLAALALVVVLPRWTGPARPLKSAAGP